MGRALFALAALGCLACIGVAPRAVGARSSVAPCSAPRLYFGGSYYRTVELGRLRPDVGMRVGTGTYVPCDSTQPPKRALRRLVGVPTDVAVRDMEHPRLLYVTENVCVARQGQRLLRCLRRAKSSSGPVFAPPSFAVTGDRYALLGYSSSCWGVTGLHTTRITCIDIVWPGDDSDVVAIPVARGGVIRFELGFVPNKASLLLYRSYADFERVELTPARVMTWVVPEDIQLPKLFEVRAMKEGSGKGSSGEGAYIGRFVEATAPPAAPTGG